uniref:Uncharacterized protein n=1 Tax=Oryza meridionalis TaxID=40149 RepID=A0A0E0EBK6_9ORYZ
MKNGKAYLKCESWYHYSEALRLNGSELGGHKLCVSECFRGRKFWSGHISPDGPGTGKKIVFSNCSDEEQEEELQAKSAI